MHLNDRLYNEFELFLLTEFQVVCDHDPKLSSGLYHMAVHLAVRVAVRVAVVLAVRLTVPIAVRLRLFGRPPHTGCPSAWPFERVKTVIARVNGNLPGGRNA